jgi:MFS family permease
MSNLHLRSPIWTRQFVTIAAANLLLFFGYQMLVSTLPLYVAALGGDPFMVGMVMSVLTIFALLTRPAAGKGLDSPLRSRLVLAGLIICTAAMLGYLWAASAALILLVRACHGVGWAIGTTGLSTMAADVIPAGRRGEGVGYFGMTTNLAMALGPVTGLYAADRFGFPALFVMSALVTALAFVITRRVKPSPAKNYQVQKGTSLVERRALFPSLLTSFMTMTYGMVITYVTLFAEEAGIEQVGLFFLGNAIMILLVRPVAGRLFDRKGPAWVLLPGAFLIAAAMLVLSQAHSPIHLLLAAIGYGAGFGSIHPTLMAWTINRVPAHRRGAAIGTYFSAFDLGHGLGALLGGIAADALGYAVTYQLGSGLMLLFLLIYGVRVVMLKIPEPQEK